MTNLTMNFELDPSLKLEKNLIRKKSGKLLLDVEGQLEIVIDGVRFFKDPYLALLEFGVNLKQWRKRGQSTKNFYHFTMEHDEREGPILAFMEQSENEWFLFSIWQEFKHEDPISTDVLLAEVDRFLAELEAFLIQHFRIKYSDFIGL